jgi:NAD(P)H-hydrate epimerase
VGTSSADVQADRPRAALGLAKRVNGVAVLKGAGSLIAAQQSGAADLLGVCGHGNPGMATAGMGDVLSGVIGGCLAQGLEPARAAVTGTCLHSYAADLAAREVGQRSLLATDLLPCLVHALMQQDEGAE